MTSIVQYDELCRMKKREAAKVFGNQSKLAKALKISKSAVSQWPEDLPESIADRIIGAALRLGLDPEVFRPDPDLDRSLSGETEQLLNEGI